MAMKYEVATGRDWCTGSAYRSICFLKGERFGVSRVVYKNNDGELFVRHKGKYIKVRKEGLRYYEV